MTAAIFAEFERLGLRAEGGFGFALELGREAEFLARLRALPVGATWWHVFPELPLDDEARRGPGVYYRLGADADAWEVRAFHALFRAFLRAQGLAPAGAAGRSWHQLPDARRGGVHLEREPGEAGPDGARAAAARAARVEAWVRAHPAVAAVHAFPLALWDWPPDEALAGAGDPGGAHRDAPT